MTDREPEVHTAILRIPAKLTFEQELYDEMLKPITTTTTPTTYFPVSTTGPDLIAYYGVDIPGLTSPKWAFKRKRP